ncbi:MAG: kelch repeat-containing protein [Thermomicrobiales bacterium]
MTHIHRSSPDAIRLTRRAASLALATGVVLAAMPSTRAEQATPSPAAPRAWTSGSPLPIARSEFPATALDGMIYVAGGFGAETAFTRLDPLTGAWKDLVPLPAPRHHLGLAALDGGIYAIGGHDDRHSATETAWRYDPTTDTWNDLPPLPQGPRGALGCAALDGRILTVGGSSGDLSGPATADVAAFDPASGSWSMLPPMPTAREHLAVAVAGSVLVAIGGRDGGRFDPTMDTAVERYDPASATWSTGSAMPDGRSGMGVATDGASIVILGGEGREGNAGIYDRVQRYDVAADTWSDLPNLPVARHGIAAAIADGVLYAIGGSTSAFTVENTDEVDQLTLPLAG